MSGPAELEIGEKEKGEDMNSTSLFGKMHRLPMQPNIILAGHSMHILIHNNLKNVRAGAVRSAFQ